MKVVGYCPMGCGQTLFTSIDGYLTCSWEKCPDPGALNKIINDPEVEHIVTFDDHYTIVHPMRERLTGLPNCELLGYLRDLSGPPTAPGTYRAVQNRRRWAFTPWP